MQILISLISIICAVQAHMQMSSPAPFRSKHNPYTTNVDYDMNGPLSSNGGNFPCKGYHKLLDTPQGRSVATWYPGGNYTFSVEGGATHAGGSCQASLSYDRGRTFTVVWSYIGRCPLKTNWPFTLPNDTPAGEALFAWTWFNNIGNREMYMNCAHVTIGARDQDDEQQSPSDPFGSRPSIFVANVGNGCSTLEGSDVKFPKPGPDLSLDSGRTAPPRGSCPN